MSSDIRYLARMQQFLAGNRSLASVTLRGGESPHIVSYAGTVVPATGAAVLSDRDVQLMAQASVVPGPAEAPAAPPAVLVRDMEYLQRFYDPSAGGRWRFRSTVFRNGTRPAVHLAIVRPADELDDVLAAFPCSLRLKSLGGSQDRVVSVDQAAGSLDDGLLAIDAPSRPLGQLYGMALLRALVGVQEAGTVAVLGTPLFDLEPGRAPLMAFEVPGDIPDPLGPVAQPHLMAAAAAFYTDLPEAFEGSEWAIPRLAGKSVVAVTAGKLRGVEALVRKYGRERTRVLSVVPQG